MNKQSYMLNDTKREIKIKTIVAYTRLFEKNHLNEAVSTSLWETGTTFEIGKIEHNLVG